MGKLGWGKKSVQVDASCDLIYLVDFKLRQLLVCQTLIHFLISHPTFGWSALFTASFHRVSMGCLFMMQSWHLLSPFPSLANSTIHAIGGLSAIWRLTNWTLYTGLSITPMCFPPLLMFSPPGLWSLRGASSVGIAMTRSQTLTGTARPVR